ncbi:hypothetical protein ACQ859_23510 [Roseateles chitinivorans]|uniref:hypothetical protein n=1 Tax=Roseateles chitinivorans TaxID=2917965 RepID=UPI003D672300
MIVEVNEQLRPEPELAGLLSDARIELDLVALCNYYLDELRLGGGDVLVFRSSAHAGELIAIDLFREPQDQLDLIYIAYVCDPSRRSVVSSGLLRFFQGCRTQVSYQMSVHHEFVRKMLDVRSYPRLREKGYRQKLLNNPVLSDGKLVG